MLIGPEHIKEFHEQGFTLVRGLLSQSAIDQIFLDVSAVFDQAIEALGEQSSTIVGCDEKMLYLKARDNDLKSHCYDVLGMLDSVQCVTANRELTEFSREVLGTPVCKQAVQIRIDDPSNDRLLRMHQELELMSLIGVNVWIPLIDITPESGGLRIVPGSHKRGLQPHVTREEARDGYSSLIWDENEEEIQHVEAEKGDALLFHPFLFHGSTANKSDHIRWTLVFRYSDLNHMPYIKHAQAPLRMSRNPDISEPGCDFVKNYR